MTGERDLVIIGAGPAGLAAAVQARRLGLDVLVVDEQPAPGGQVWRALESRAARSNGGYRDDAVGEAWIRDFRASGADYQPETQVWQIEPGLTVYASRAGTTDRLCTRALLIATGAQERPVPFRGWTLPGVMPVGAAQILLKTSGQIPIEPVLIAGTGPLVLLYACQLLDAGGRIAGILDTAPAENRAAARRHMIRALARPRELARGLGWMWRLRRAGVPIIRGVSKVEAMGKEALEAVRFPNSSGVEETRPAKLLLVHEGVIPSIHMTLALGCAHTWSEDQLCFAPRLDAWGESSVDSVFVAGDGTGIAGAAAACLKGGIAAIGVAKKLGRLDPTTANGKAAPLRKQLEGALATRALLDALYRPRREILTPSDDTIVCRCEEVTAREIRRAAKVGIAGPNQVKAFTRCGMGPCQGRQCGYTVSALIAEVTGASMEEVGFYRIRPPLKPVTLGELASIRSDDVAVMA